MSTLQSRLFALSQLARALPAATRITAPIRYIHRRVRSGLTGSDWESAHSCLCQLHASIVAHSLGFAAIVHALEANPGVIPHEQFICGFRSARAGPEITVDEARQVREKLQQMEVRLAGELLTLREYEREWYAGVVMGRMRMSDGELDHVVAYIRSWVSGGGRTMEVEEVLEEAAWWLVFETEPIGEWEVVRRVGCGGAGVEAEREGVGGVLKLVMGGGELEGGLRRRRVGAQ